jgi:hypothetical protein
MAVQVRHGFAGVPTVVENQPEAGFPQPQRLGYFSGF